MPKIKRALISVSDKSGVVDLAKELAKMNVEIISTGGTAKALRDNKIKVTEISDYTGSPEILDGRLKTLHPKIHGGILGMRTNATHAKEMAANQIQPIDMVIVNLYPFEATIAKKDCTLEEAIENIDIGGPTMLRAAAKNWQDVAVVVDPADYQMIIDEMKDKREVSNETCFKLAQKVFASTARYDAAICNYINGMSFPRGRESHEPKCARSPLTAAGMTGQSQFPATYAMTWNKAQELRYGENPHQKAAFYKCPHLPTDAPVISNGIQLHGKELSYNNIMDSDAALELVKEFAGETAAVVIKHTNPCGVAVSKDSIADAFVKARDCDPTSAFGGIVALTKDVDDATAKAIGDTFFEVIIAPGFEAKALDVLKAKKNLRLLEIPDLGARKAISDERFTLRKVGGGLLVQTQDDTVTDIKACKVVTKRKPTKEELAALDFNWRVVKHVKSNAIVIGGADRIYGVGAGQTSRVDSVKIAISKIDCSPVAGHCPLVLASDAFFPFRDGIDIAAKSKVTAVIQPGGSLRDEEVIKACDEHGIAMVVTGVRHFRH
jgi:phosphoribosylaminoimidazolecarboxamide formyltransferase/IMP cyclohydrolase